MLKIRRAVFPAAGLGTRFLPATKTVPKEMLPLVDKPIIQYAVEETVGSGIENIVIVTGRGKSAIEDHFDTSFELETVLAERGKTKELNLMQAVSGTIPISYIRQKEALGLVHAILTARDLVNNEPFAALLPDDVIVADPPCTKQMIDIFNQYQTCIVAIMEVPRDQTNRYGIIQGDPLPDGNGQLYEVRDMVEKPSVDKAPSNLAVIGRYILTPSIFEALAKTEKGSGGEIQLTDGLRKLMAKQRVIAYKFDGKRYDAGDKLGFLKATVACALKSPELGPEFSAYLKSLDIDKV
ncbi:MAG: UTP--glucose-1-phosphate uridylyltransferase GalU [Acidobacteriota bacterium]